NGRRLGLLAIDPADRYRYGIPAWLIAQATIPEQSMPVAGEDLAPAPRAYGIPAYDLAASRIRRDSSGVASVYPSASHLDGQLLVKGLVACPNNQSHTLSHQSGASPEGSVSIVGILSAYGCQLTP